VEDPHRRPSQDLEVASGISWISRDLCWGTLLQARQTQKPAWSPGSPSQRVLLGYSACYESKGLVQEI